MEIDRDALRKPMPPESIKQHPTKSFLSTIKAIYVVERLNDVFGIGGWNMEHEIVSDTDEYVTVKGRIFYDGDGSGELIYRTPEQYGGHKKTGTNTEPADGYKSAVTDCMSKCASYLEIGIDVFKGKVSPPPKQQQQTKPEKDNTLPKEMSKKQWNYIKSIGEKEHGMTEPEVVTFVKWVATMEDIDPRHWKMAELLLPEDNFEKMLAQYITYRNELTGEK